MGSKQRIRPEKLPKKLAAIRKHLGLSMSEMALKLSDDDFSIRRTDISKYELDQREPNLIILLRYAELVQVSTDILIKDSEELPQCLDI